MESHTIMCPAADYPIKGLHMLLKALAIVKKQYPDVKLYVPGSPLRPTNTLKAKLKETGYAGEIEADGGLRPDNLQELIDCGLTVAVMGTALFHAENPAEEVAALHRMVPAHE